MKIKSRDQRLREYNEVYPVRPSDSLELIEEYFKSHNLSLEKACDRASKKLKVIMDERSYESIHILLYEYPMETARARVVQGHAYSPNAAANKRYFEKAMEKVIETMRLITTPAEVRVDGYLEMPSTVPPDEVILFESKVLDVVSKPDGDNLIKAYLDMMTSVLTSDDDLFYHLEVNKYFSLLPRVDIYVDYLKKNESDYIYRKLKARKTIKEGIKAGRVVLEKLEYPK